MEKQSRGWGKSLGLKLALQLQSTKPGNHTSSEKRALSWLFVRTYGGGVSSSRLKVIVNSAKWGGEWGMTELGSGGRRGRFLCFVGLHSVQFHEG